MEIVPRETRTGHATDHCCGLQHDSKPDLKTCFSTAFRKKLLSGYIVNDPTSSCSFNTHRFKIKAIYLSVYSKTPTNRIRGHDG